MRLPAPFLKLSTDLSLLSIAQNAGKIYLGEMFRACVSITHKASRMLRNCTITIEVHTPQERHLLLKTDTFDFDVDQTRDFILQHRIEELDDTCMVCSIQYHDSNHDHDHDHDAGSGRGNGDQHQQSFQKFYRFFIESPLDVQSGIHHTAAIVQDSQFVQVEITNRMEEPVCIEHVDIIADAKAQVRDLNTTDTGAITALDSKSAISYMFQVDNNNHERGLRAQIQWRAGIGRTGIMTTQVMKRRLNLGTGKNMKRIHARIVQCPDTVVLEKVFATNIEITNNSTQTIETRIRIQKGKMKDVVVAGKASKAIALQAGDTQVVQMNFIPLALGVQQVGAGIEIDDVAVEHATTVVVAQIT
jgi:Protein of unknown function (DUF974)